MVKTVWVSVTPTTPRPSTRRKSSRRKRLPGSVKRISKSNRRPASVKRVAANRIGGTRPALRFPFAGQRGPRLTYQVRLGAEGLYVSGDRAGAVLDVF